MKIISVVIPCYNDANSIQEMYNRLKAVFEALPEYDYEIIYADDCSPDNTWEKIAEICKTDYRVKGVHNITNFGAARNSFQALKYASGDIVFWLMGDLEQPPEILPTMLDYQNSGYDVVIGIYREGASKGLMGLCRKIYYKLVSKLSNKKIIQGFSGFGVYKKEFIQAIKNIQNVQPYMPGLISEYGGNIKILDVKHEVSKRGRSNQNFVMKYDYAMVGLTSYTKTLMRIVTFIGCAAGILAILLALYFFITKLLYWDTFALGIPALIVGEFIFSSVQLFFLGILGEYVLSINERTMDRPVTVADQTLNFDILESRVDRKDRRK